MSDWASGFEEGFVESGTVRLHYVATGPADGEPVLLIHGFPQFSYEWRRHLPRLAEQGYRVVALDMRGYGQSDRPDGVEAYRMQNLVGDIAAVYKAMGWASANVVAHDWGGAVSWLFVTFYPQLVKRFVVMDIPHPTAFRAALQTMSQIHSSWYIWFFQAPDIPEKVFGRDLRAFMDYMMRGTASRSDTFSDEDFQVYVDAISQPGALTAALNYYRANTTQSNVYSDSATTFPPIQPPTLLLYGTADFAFQQSAWNETAKQVAGSFQSVGIPGASHWLPEEEPEETLRLILEHLKRPV